MKTKQIQHQGSDREVVLYAEDEEGQYVPVRTGSALASVLARELDSNLHHFRAYFQEQLRSGQIGAIGYYAGLQDLTPSSLAARVGLSARVVKRHLRPEGTRGLDPDLVQRYCEVFDLDDSALFAIPLDDGSVWEAPE